MGLTCALNSVWAGRDFQRLASPILWDGLWCGLRRSVELVLGLNAKIQPSPLPHAGRPNLSCLLIRWSIPFICSHAHSRNDKLLAVEVFSRTSLIMRRNVSGAICMSVHTCLSVFPAARARRTIASSVVSVGSNWKPFARSMLITFDSAFMLSSRPLTLDLPLRRQAIICLSLRPFSRRISRSRLSSSSSFTPKWTRSRMPISEGPVRFSLHGIQRHVCRAHQGVELFAVHGIKRNTHAHG